MKPLDIATDRLNAAIAAAEAALIEERHGVHASVRCEDGELSFEKRGSDWGLYYTGPGTAAVPIAHATRRVRVDAARVIDSLRDALLAVAEQAALDMAASANVLEQAIRKWTTAGDRTT